MGLSIWQVLLVVILFMLLFGRGKIPALMSDLATGIKSFKAGIKEDENVQAVNPDMDKNSPTTKNTATVNNKTNGI